MLKHVSAQLCLAGFLPERRAEPVKTGAVLRDSGIAKVKANNEQWMVDAMAILRDWKAPVEVTAENIRLVVASKIGEPTHPHAWGALTRSAAVKGVIADTGRSTQSKLPSSRAARLVVWRFTGGQTCG